MRYTPDQVEFLRQGYLQMRIPELTAAFNSEFNTNLTRQQIKSFMGNHKFTCGRVPGNPKGTLLLFSQEQAEFLRDGYTRLKVAELTVLFNRHFDANFTLNQVRAYLKNHGCKSGRTGNFVKGHTPHNTGQKGWDAGGRSAETRFKGGRRPQDSANYVPIGSTKLSKDRYLMRKVTDDHPVPARRWDAEHRLVWAAAHGPIPDGHVVVFLDGDKLNIALDNLRCVPRGVLQYLNKTGMNNTTGEARKAAILTAELITLANRKARDRGLR